MVMKMRRNKFYNIKMVLLICILAVCICVPANAATLKKGIYTYSTKTRGEFGKEKTTIYKQKKGGKKKKLVTVYGTIYKFNGIYDNKLLYVRHYGDCAPEFTAIEYLNLKNNRRVILKRNQEIACMRGRYLLAIGAGDSEVSPLNIVNIKNKRVKRLANNVMYGGAFISKNGKVYYLECKNYKYNEAKSKFTVYSCRKDGSGKKKLKTFYCKNRNCAKTTEKYVIMSAYKMKKQIYYF